VRIGIVLHRQYVITLSGHGELEVGEERNVVGPGSIDLVEDTTAKVISRE